VLLACLLIGLGWGIGSGVTLLLHQLPVFPPPRVEPAKLPAAVNPAAIPPELELRYQILKNQLDNAVETSKQLDRLLTLLLTLTSLYALALGLNSYFGLKQILESGKEDLSKLRDFLSESRSAVRDKLAEVDTKLAGAVASANSQLSDFRTELREKYPELASLHANLRDILDEIRLMFPTGRDWIKEYAELTTQQREKVGVAEMRFIGLEVFRLGNVDRLRPNIRQVYQGLGRFYSSRYRNEKQRPYWERASLYFQTAVRLDPAEPRPELLKDQGVHLTLVEQILDLRVAAPGGAPATPREIREVEMLRSSAEQAFRESLSGNPLEPGALFGLAWLLYKKTDYRDAIAQYALVTTITLWAPGDRQKFLEDAYLNQACCYSLLAGDPADPECAAALDCLKQSKDVAVECNRLLEWKAKIEEEANAKDLRRLHALRAQDLDAILKS
jgi:tetratricopeptide (TPR) repeat protein